MTPPTYSPWLRAFEVLGRLNLGGGMHPSGSPGTVGDVMSDRDADGDVDWLLSTDPKTLFSLWGPPPASPWSGYHRPTLFAASHQAIRPRPAGLLENVVPREPLRVPKDRAVVLDLPGPVAVALGAWLAKSDGFQPVVMANNWPHPNGVVDLGATLAALLFYAPWASADRDLRGDRAPPVFILDRGRLGRLPNPGDFDNRFYHTDADFPSPATLRRNGIRGVVYVHPEEAAASALPPSAIAAGWTPVEEPLVPSSPSPPVRVDLDDVHPWLRECHKQLGLVETAAWRRGHYALGPPGGFDPSPRKTPFNTSKDPAFAGFRRASAGGFGRIVPQPSQGGGYYAGGGFG